MGTYCTRPSFLMCVALLAIAGGLLQGVHGHLYMMTPVSRNFWGTTVFNDPSFELVNFCPHCYQSRGPAMIRARAESLTDPEELARECGPTYFVGDMSITSPFTVFVQEFSTTCPLTAVDTGYGNGAWPLLTAYEMGEIAANGNYLESDAISVRHGICGDPEQTSSEDSNRYGRANTNYPVLETYSEGSVLEVKIVVSTTHEGHMEFFLCNAADMDDPDGVVTQGCFNKHPLDRAEDDGVASPIDPNHPGRYYLDPPCRASETDQTIVPGAEPGYVVTAHYQLPSGVTCSRCIVQMAYYTGNSCMHPGYDEFNPDSWPSECAPSKGDWIKTGLGMCGDGDNYPEEYWNCADIEITADGSPSDLLPSPSPISESTLELETPTPVDNESTMLGTPSPVGAEPTVPETPAPVFEETPAPVIEETLEPDTPAPVSDVTTVPETPTPVIEETIELETPAPTPLEGEPFNEPIFTTLPPATFAPSVVATQLPPDECDDPVAAYGQCGGDSYEGSTCCRPGYTCTAVASCFSECRPMAEDACSEGWGQCGGRNWEGPSCCWPGAECLERNEWYSQCVPETGA